GKVLGGTWVVRDVSDGSRKVKVELGFLGVAEVALVLENGGDEIIDGVLANIVAGNNDGGDSDSGAVLGGAVDILGDGVGAVVRAALDEGVDVLLVKADKVDVVAAGKVGDGR